MDRVVFGPFGLGTGNWVSFLAGDGAWARLSVRCGLESETEPETMSRPDCSIYKYIRAGAACLLNCSVHVSSVHSRLPDSSWSSARRILDSRSGRWLQFTYATWTAPARAAAPLPASSRASPLLRRTRRST
jgi:hypothetical protein